MLLRIAPAPTDDETFLTAISGMLTALAEKRRPALVHVVRVDNWFDHKWLRFSGIGRVPLDRTLGRSPLFHTAIDPFWQESLTFPPFSPRRIVSETTYERQTASLYRKAEPALRVHAPVRQNSAHNLQRRISLEFPSALFVWFSSQSKVRAHASLLVYEAEQGATTAWYASFQAVEGIWKVNKTKEINRAEADSLFPKCA